MRSELWRPVGVEELEPAADEAVRSDSSTVLVAGPGAGKTELLAQRACYLLQTGICRDPHRILAISFKRDAARNLKERVALRCTESLSRRFDSYTFDAFAKGMSDRFLHALPEPFRPSADYEIIDLNERNILQYVLSIPSNQSRLTTERHVLNAHMLWEAFIGRALPASHGWENKSDEEVGSEDLLHFLLHGGSKSRVPFPLIGRMAELLLRTNPAILSALRRTYKYVFLDEFQDTTRIQYSLIRRAFLGSDAVLTAVGDKKQRIMGWAGAMQKAFDEFAKDFNAQRLALAYNYRSSEELVRVQSVIAQELDPSSVTAISMASGGEDSECRLLTFRDDDEEADKLAYLVSDWLRQGGIRPRDICILCRMKPAIYAMKLQRAFDRKGVRSRIENDLQDLLAEPLCEVLLDMLKLAAKPSAPEAWGRMAALLISLDGRTSDLALRRLVDGLLGYIDELRSALRADSLNEEAIMVALRSVMSFVGENSYKTANPQYQQGNYYEQQLQNIARVLAAARSNRNWADTIDEVEGVDCVPIMTMHKSKGLEYHTVIFVGLEDGALWNYSNNQVEETCGIFVALSRAKKRVIFTFCGVRPTGRHGERRPQYRATIDSLYRLLAEAGFVVEQG